MSDYCEPLTMYRWSEPVAKNPHRCCECSAPIANGEKHFSWSGKLDADFDHGRQHLLCMEACEFIRDELNDGECIGFGSLMEEWSDMRWQYDRLRDREKPAWKRLRKMIADIKRRERRGM